MEVRFTTETINTLCALMPRPQIVQGMLVSWMRNHFSSSASIEAPTLKNKLWSADPAQTEIVVDSVYRWQPALTEARPGVFIKRGGWRVLQLGIDNRKMGVTPISGHPQYVAYLQGSHTLFCIGAAPDEAEILGTEVYRELLEFGPQIRKNFNFLKLQVMGVGELSLIEEARQSYVVPISIAYAVEDTWEIVQQAPPLKTVTLSSFLP